MGLWWRFSGVSTSQVWCESGGENGNDIAMHSLSCVLQSLRVWGTMIQRTECPPEVGPSLGVSVVWKGREVD